jgi:hypothetical protein
MKDQERAQRSHLLGKRLATARIEIDNNAAERALPVVALGRKNFLFAGSDGGHHIIESRNEFF